MDVGIQNSQAYTAVETIFTVGEGHGGLIVPGARDSYLLLV